MYAWTLQIKVPADTIRYHTCNRASSDSSSLRIVGVHGSHSHVVFQHGRREDCGARTSETFNWNTRYRKKQKQIVSITFTASRDMADWAVSHLSQKLCRTPPVSNAALDP
jgi:hypothetical protein